MPVTVVRRSFGSGMAWIAAPALVAVLMGALLAGAPAVTALVTPAIVVVIFLVALVHFLDRSYDETTRRRLMRWTLAAFAVHAIIGDYIWLSPKLTTYFGGDAFTYFDGSTALLQHWQGLGPMPALPVGKEGFFFMSAGLFSVFGTNAACAIVVNAACTAAMIPLLSDATNRHFGADAAKYVAPLCLFMPGFLVWGSQLLREATIYFGIALCLNAAVRLYRRLTLSSITMMAAGIVLVILWRASVGVLLAGGVLVGQVLHERRAHHTFATVITVCIAAVLVIGIGLGHSGYTFVTTSNLDTINGIRSYSASSAASGFLPNSDVSNGSHAIAYLPLGMVAFLFGPFPWQIHIGRQLFSIPDVLVWWSLLPSLALGLREARKRVGREVFIYISPALAITAGLSLLIANYGTAIRERMQVVVLLIPIIALGISRFVAREKEVEEKMASHPERE